VQERESDSISMKFFLPKYLFFSAIVALTPSFLSAATAGDPSMVVVEQEEKTESSSAVQQQQLRRRATAAENQFSGMECSFVHCDFSTLDVASYISSSAQTERLLRDCGIISVTAEKDGQSRNVNIFNSSNLLGRSEDFDWDLGSPNAQCPIPGPGRGRGGNSDSQYANCNPQGNLLIIQNTSLAESTPNDAGDGGCMYIKFQNMVNLDDMGLLDMEDPMTIAVHINQLFFHTSFPSCYVYLIVSSFSCRFFKTTTTTGHRQCCKRDCI
jgi:hypothetical protein